MKPMSFDFLAQAIRQEDGVFGACSNNFFNETVSPLGILLIIARNKHNYSQEEFAKVCNIDLHEIKKIEGDENFHPDVRTLSCISRYLNIETSKIAEIAGYKNERKEKFEDRIYSFAANCTNIDRNKISIDIYEHFIAILEKR